VLGGRSQSGNNADEGIRQAVSAVGRANGNGLV